jgi:hypothetical protein
MHASTYFKDRGDDAMQTRRLIQLATALAMLTLAACKDEPEKPESEKTAGDEIEDTAKDAKQDVDEATEEAGDDIEDATD